MPYRSYFTNDEGEFTMARIRKTACLNLWLASIGLFSLLSSGTLHAQEIRAIAEPNQSIRMGRGGYVCEGRLTHTPIDATENWTYEMVQCTGPIYNSYDYGALHAKLTHDELVKLNSALDQLNTTSSATQDTLSKQAVALNSDLRAMIEKRFQALPQDMLLSKAIQNLKKSLIEYVDQRLPRTNPTNPSERKSPPPGRR
jgi:hypothetical protein